MAPSIHRIAKILTKRTRLGLITWHQTSRKDAIEAYRADFETPSDGVYHAVVFLKPVEVGRSKTLTPLAHLAIYRRLDEEEEHCVYGGARGQFGQFDPYPEEDPPWRRYDEDEIEPLLMAAGDYVKKLDTPLQQQFVEALAQA